MKMTVKTSGFAELEKKLLALPAAASRKVMRGALMAALTPLVKRAKELVAVDEGDLKRSIKKRSAIYKGNNFAAEAGVYISRKLKAGHRWHFEEFGTSKHAARPFLRPAFDEKKMEVLERFKAELSKRIDKAAK